MRRHALRTMILALVAACGAAQANLLLNAGFELPDGGGSATNWWTYSAAGTRQSWAAYNGTYGAAFFTAGNQYGGIGQDVATNLNNGDVLTLSLYGKAETGYNVSDTYIELQFFTGGSMTYALTNNVYSALTQSMNTWNQISVVRTNTVSGITMVKPVIAYTGCTIPDAGHTAQWDDVDLAVQAIPEPTVAGLLVLAGAALFAFRRTRRKECTS
jgi:hypothetical protein